jgi:hypothetical protein
VARTKDSSYGFAEDKRLGNLELTAYHADNGVCKGLKLVTVRAWKPFDPERRSYQMQFVMILEVELNGERQASLDRQLDDRLDMRVARNLLYNESGELGFE